MRLARLLLFAWLCIAPRLTAAQAIVSGTLFDSLRTRAPLVDATVFITELDRFAVTDATGHFTFAERIPVGTWSLTFSHPVLDSLSIGAGVLRLIVADTAPTSVRFSTPSPQTLVRRLCPNAESETGLVIGTVRDASTGRPIAGATVETEWAEVDVAHAMQRLPRAAKTRSTEAGAFLLCGVPTDIGTEYHAVLDSTRTGPVELFLGDAAVRRRDFILNPGGLAHTVLSGTLRDANGRPASDAAISVGPGLVTTRTDANGRYAFPAAPAGTQLIEARVLGARPVRVSVDLESAAPKVLDIDFERIPVELPTVAINGKQAARGRFAEFLDRRKTGAGTYITRDDIDRRKPFDLINLLTAGGLSYRVARNGQRSLTMRGSSSNNCSPTYYVDGVRWMGGAAGSGASLSGGAAAGSSAIEELTSFYRPQEIRAVEIYKGFGTIPSQYDPSNGCGVVLIWTG